jgi:hypothetical protein
MEIENWNTGLSIIVSVLTILGAIGGVFLYIRNRIANVEESIRATMQTMLRDEAVRSVTPLVEAGIERKLATLEQQLQAIDLKAEAGYRYVRYLQEGRALTQMRIVAKGADWRGQAVRVRAMPNGRRKDAEEAALLQALVGICEPVIANAVVNEAQKLAPGDLGYRGLVDAYARLSGIDGQPWAQREQAFHERLTTSCIKGLQEKMYSFLGPSAGGAPEFYTQAITVCTISIIGDIAAVRRGDLGTVEAQSAPGIDAVKVAGRAE